MQTTSWKFECNVNTEDQTYDDAFGTVEVAGDRIEFNGEFTVKKADIIDYFEESTDSEGAEYFADDLLTVSDLPENIQADILQYNLTIHDEINIIEQKVIRDEVYVKFDIYE